jgi:hypothetical protein
MTMPPDPFEPQYEPVQEINSFAKGLVIASLISIPFWVALAWWLF